MRFGRCSRGDVSGLGVLLREEPSKWGFNSGSNHCKQLSTCNLATSSSFGTPRKVSAHAFSTVFRIERVFGKKVCTSGDECPIRAWISKMEMPGFPRSGKRLRPKILMGRE